MPDLPPDLAAMLAETARPSRGWRDWELSEYLRALVPRVVAAEAENAHLRNAIGIDPSRKVAGSEPGSLLLDTEGGQRLRVTMMREELDQLEAAEARVQELEAESASRLKSFEEVKRELWEAKRRSRSC